MQQLFLYGVLEDAPSGISAKLVREELEKLDPSKPLLVRMNSVGGEVFEGITIRTLLSEWKAGVDVQVDGLAASMASHVATVGTVTMARDAMMMIHDVWSLTLGNAEDHLEAANTLDMISDVLTNAYAQKSGKSHEEIRSAMKAETWLTAAGAVEFGLADYVLDENGKRIAARMRTRNVAALERHLAKVRGTI